MSSPAFPLSLLVLVLMVVTIVVATPVSYHHSQRQLNAAKHRSSAEPDHWRNVLATMTQENPCGSAENYKTCTRCGDLTGDTTAFYRCCLNTEDLRPWCIQFLNHKIE